MPEFERPDTSDVDRWIGRPIGGGQMVEPITRNDVRRWVQAMHNPNPIYYNEDAARASERGEFVAPQSFAVACAWNHGATPALQGKIPGTHMLFGGDHFWFFGPAIRPGDLVRTSRVAFGYKVKDTSFAGPTVFQQGDTTYVNQRGEFLALQRSTAVRYLIANAAQSGGQSWQDEPDWTDDALARVDKERQEYYRTFHDKVIRTPESVDIGEELPVGVIGVHSVATLTTEWRAYIGKIWGTFDDDGIPTSSDDAGWIAEFTKDKEASEIDPAQSDGLYYGSSRGHVDARYARMIGMPRPYGYGASMGAYVLDYVANWAGQKGFICEADLRYSYPVFVGDVTYLRGVVAGTDADRPGTLRVEVTASNQNGAQMVKGSIWVRLS
jgi:acyl dehydratase